jgi:hypothetical protein
MSQFTIRGHPSDPDLVVVQCGEDGNAVMGRLGSARLVPQFRGYVVAAAHLPQLRKLVDRAGGTLTDGRHGDRGDTGTTPDPLPECADCGTPRRRNRVTADGTVTPVPAPRFCPDCGAPWVDRHYRAPGTAASQRIVCARCGHQQAASSYRRCTGCGELLDAQKRPIVEEPTFDDSRDIVTASEAMATLELVAARGAAISPEQAAINVRGLDLVRESMRLAALLTDPASVERARTTSCSWCSAKPGDPCATDAGQILRAVHSVRLEQVA